MGLTVLCTRPKTTDAHSSDFCTVLTFGSGAWTRPSDKNGPCKGKGFRCFKGLRCCERRTNTTPESAIATQTFRGGVRNGSVWSNNEEGEPVYD